MPSETSNPFQFHESTRRYSLDGPVGLKNARLSIEVNGATYWAEQAAHVEWAKPAAGDAASPAVHSGGKLEFRDPPFAWVIRFEWRQSHQGLAVQSTLINRGKHPLKLGRCRLVDTSDASSEVRFGSNPAQAAVLYCPGAGNPPWHSRGLANSAEPIVSKPLAQWFTPGQGPALQVGFVSFDRAETVVQSSWDKSRQLPVVSAWNDFNGFELKPGASVDAETLLISVEADPLAAMDHWADVVHERYQPPIWPKAPAGWVGWAWVDPFFVESYEEVVKRNAHAVRDRLKLDENDVGYVWVSVGNIKDILPGNWLRWNYKTFPSGPEALHKELESLNFRWGLWTGFFWLSSQLTEEVERLKDALLQYQGKPVTIPHRDLGKMYVLDPTHPKTQEFIREVYSTYRRWGVRYYMLDFLDAMTGATPGLHPNDGYFDKSKIPGPEAWREGLRAIRETVTDDTYLLGSTGPAFQLVGLVNAHHLGNDYGDGRPLYGPNKGFYPVTFVINNPRWWTSHHTALITLGAFSFIHRKLYIGDTGSVLTIDKPISQGDAQITVTIFGINGGQMMMGDDVSRMDEGRMKMIRMVFPRLPEIARPLDLFAKAELDYPQLFHLPVEREWDRWDLLAVFNLEQETLLKTVTLERLRLDSAAPYAVWDFWNGKYLGEVIGQVTVEVPPNNVKLLRIARTREHPWLLSTDLHVRQGQAEILDCQWDADALTLTIRAQRPAGHEGSIYAHAPKGWALAEPKGLWLARDGRDNSLVIRKLIKFEEEPVDVVMRFKRF